jgi:hypothetical protein
VSEPSGRSRIPLNAMDFIGKALIALGAACYIAGLLVVNIYLRSFGFSDFSLLRTRFVLTGVISLAPLLIISTTMFAVLYATAGRHILGELLWGGKLRENRSDVIIGSISARVVIIVGTFALGTYYVVSGIDISVYGFTSLAGSVATVFSIAFLMSVTILVFIDAMERYTEFVQYSEIGNRSELNKVRNNVVLVSVITVILCTIYTLLYLQYFAANFYPAISAHIGGGKAKWIQLVLHDDKKVAGIGSGLMMDGESNRTKPVPLLWEGESALLIVLPEQSESGWTVQIDKSLVASVLVQMEQPSARWFVDSSGNANEARFPEPAVHVAEPLASPIISTPAHIN